MLKILFLIAVAILLVAKTGQARRPRGYPDYNDDDKISGNTVFQIWKAKLAK